MKNRRITLLPVFIFLLIFVSCKETKVNHSNILADTLRIKNSLNVICKTPQYRNYLNIGSLDSVADYIFKDLSFYCDSVYFQAFIVNGIEYKNIIGVQGLYKNERIVIGAHYDVAGNQEGADDNASGVCGILELARLLSKVEQKHRIDFVAYTLEEPPFFRTEQMGSYFHAKSLYDNKIKIKGMVCLEMIGYFNDNPNSQKYPVGFLKWFYGNKGDFITVVQKFGNGKFGRQFDKLMNDQQIIKTKSFKSPAWLPGVDFSDHLNYWKFGYSAVMVTNTAFYRNKNYHEPADRIETLDIKRMGLVIDEVYETIIKLN